MATNAASSIRGTQAALDQDGRKAERTLWWLKLSHGLGSSSVFARQNPGQCSCKVPPQYEINMHSCGKEHSCDCGIRASWGPVAWRQKGIWDNVCARCVHSMNPIWAHVQATLLFFGSHASWGDLAFVGELECCMLLVGMLYIGLLGCWVNVCCLFGCCVVVVVCWFVRSSSAVCWAVACSSGRLVAMNAASRCWVSSQNIFPVQKNRGISQLAPNVKDILYKRWPTTLY